MCASTTIASLKFLLQDPLQAAQQWQQQRCHDFQQADLFQQIDLFIQQTQASALDVLALWEDHGVHVVCPLQHTRALVQ